MKVFCKQCGNAVPEGDKFCISCGTEIGEANGKNFCANCGMDVTNMDYCINCGTPVSKDKKAWVNGNAAEAASGSSKHFLDRLCLLMGNGSYERAGRNWCIALLATQSLYVLLLVLAPNLNISIGGVLLFFVAMDWRCLSKQGIRGAWKIWGIFVLPVYLMIRAKKTDRKYKMAVISCLIILLGFVLGFMQGFWREFTTSFWREFNASFWREFQRKSGSVEKDVELSLEEDKTGRQVVRKLVLENVDDGDDSLVH